MDLDRERIEALMVEILKPINANYQRGPLGPDRVLEALNALAAAAALVIGGAESQSRDPKPEQFFRQALENHLL